MTLDLAAYPFSRCGSYFSASVMDDRGGLGDGLYIRTHHNGAAQAFRIEPIRNAEPVPFEIQATPTRTILEAAGGGMIEIIIADLRSVRIRGTGVSLRMVVPPARWRFAYQLGQDAWAVNLPKSGVQFAVESISGRLEVAAPWEQGEGFCYVTTSMTFTLDPDGESFQVAIDEFESSWSQPERRAFDECLADVETEFDEWMADLPPAWTPGTEGERAGYVNWSACVRPSGYITRTTMLMSKMSMCNVFGWDHAFNAMAHWRHRPDLAWDQFMVFAERERADGKPPDNMNDQSIMYTFSKPPIHGWALRRMRSANPSALTSERLEEVYTHMSRWTSWWTTKRRWQGQVLAHYIHGFDSGWDNSTIFDRGTPLASPDLAAYLVYQTEILAELAEQTGRQEEAAHWRSEHETILEALVTELWQGTCFAARIEPTGELVESESLITCMPIVLGPRLPAEITDSLVATVREHLTDWGLATERPSSRHYRANSYWRGPIWAPSTLLVVSGLEELGEDELARTIAKRYCLMCEMSGFAENFDALSGAGHFDPAYTWTSSVYMILAERYLR